MTTTNLEVFMDFVHNERERQQEIGWTKNHDRSVGVIHLLSTAIAYASNPEKSVETAALILAAIEVLEYKYAKNSMQLDVEKFMHIGGQEVKLRPENPSDDIRELRASLMYEELMGTGELIDSMQKGDLIGVADGLADLLYVVFGTAAAYGINVQEVFNEVQRSNMTKFIYDAEDDEYIVLRREDGKILKPESFSPAHLGPIVERQINATEIVGD